MSDEEKIISFANNYFIYKKVRNIDIVDANNILTNKTEEEKRKAQLKWSQNYYLKNRQQVLDKARQRYINKKSEKIKKELYGE